MAGRDFAVNKPHSVAGRFATYAYAGCLPTVKQQIVEMKRNGSGIQDICARAPGRAAYGAQGVKNKRPASHRSTKAWLRGAVQRR